MKVTMEFDLPEERNELIGSIKSMSLFSVIWSMDQWLRGKIKYDNREEFEEVRQQLRDLLDTYTVNLNEFE